VRTRFTELVGCDLPIQLAAMSGIVTPELAAAVSNAGGLGMLAVGRRTYDVMAPQVDAVLELTDRPIGAGFIVEFLDRDTVAAMAERVPILEFFWGSPDATLVEGECADRIVGWQVGSVDEAGAAAACGCAYVVVQGVEAGGHVRASAALSDLLPAARDAIGDDVALVAAGGIATADDVRAAIDRGADAVRVGSRFVAADESAAHGRYVELLIGADDAATELTDAFSVGWPDAPHRVLASAIQSASTAPEVVGEVPDRHGANRAVPRWSVSPPTRDTTGLIDAMALYAGAHLSPIAARRPASEIVAELMAELVADA
jgi:nitronate monooxygenase